MKLLVTSGRGPAECRIAVAETVRLIAAEAGQGGWDVSIVSSKAHPHGHGAASVVILVDGEGVEVWAQSWIGTVQQIAQSTVRPGHKRKNWYVSVSELAVEPDRPPLDPNDVAFETFRAGGPGGQHQNTTDSAVRATHKPTGFHVVVRDGRSQHQNKKAALLRLADLLETKEQIDQGRMRDEAQKCHDHLERGNPVRIIG